LVEQSLSHADADIRAHAVLSLARIETDAAHQLILDALRHDEDEDVRVIALHLAGDPDRPGALDLLRNTVTGSPSERLRAEALAGLTTWGDDEAVIRVVQTVAIEDPSADIREYAAEWLQIHLASLAEENSWLSGVTP
jgi:HEAT repeat protein